MTKDEINRAVAEKVMGWHIDDLGEGDYSLSDYYEYFDSNGTVMSIEDWNPAERIDHAWMVVEKFLFVTLNGAPGRYTCRLISQYDDMGNGMWGTATTENAPMAICLAALKAKEGGE